MSLRSVLMLSSLLSAALLGCSAPTSGSSESNGMSATGTPLPQGGMGAVGDSNLVDSTPATDPAIGGGGALTGGEETTIDGSGTETSGEEAGGEETTIGSGEETGGGEETTVGAGTETNNAGTTSIGAGTQTNNAGATSIGAGTQTDNADGTETGNSTQADNAGGTETGNSTEPGGPTVATAVALDNPAPASNFTEEVGDTPFEMAYVPGGTFTLGCESGNCPQYADPVSGVEVSSYHIGKTEVTAELWNAVMGESSSGFGGPSMTWYDAMEFACELSHMTGRAYRMPTEAEFEYAAKNHLSSLEDIGSGEEWAYNSWETSHTGGTDPVGPDSGQHTQKTRRDAQGTADNITGRLIRSIDGVGPVLRLAISHGSDFPPNYVPPCELHPPEVGDEPVNSYRDMRWVTGNDAHWTTGSIAIGSFDLRVWEDGTAKMGNTAGQWFTSNNIAFVFVPSSGSSTKYAYIFLDATRGSLLSDESFMSGGYIGRIEKAPADNEDKPTISNLQSGAELAAAAGDDYEMIDMLNIPESAKEQDPRLLDGTGQGWFQDNRSAGGVHHYRKDVDPDEFRFTVNQGGNMVMLANGEWFTVNNTFLRVTHSSGYTTDYLYAVDSSGTFYHNSFQAYERADFRMFQLEPNGSDTFAATCGSICDDEIPKGEGPSIYANMDNGHSTFVPAPCPADGCR